jgi:hypothetical protein
MVRTMQTVRPDCEKQAAPFWSVIKANMTRAGEPHEEAFSDWYSAEHVPEWVAKEGFLWGCRLRRIDVEGQIGTAEHKYLAAYGIDEVNSFNAALADGPPWGPWQRTIDEYVCDWERTYYRVLDAHEPDRTRGKVWALMKVDLDASADEGAFNDWYSGTHLPEIAASPGICRAYRLRVEPDDNDLGPRRQRYWAVYECERAEDLVAAREARFERGAPAWDGIWSDAVRNVQLAFYELIFEIPRHAALRAVRA